MLPRRVSARERVVERRALGDTDREQALLELVDLGQIIRAHRRSVGVAHRQQLAADGEHEDHAEREDRQAEGGEVEQLERLEAALGQDLGRQDVGRRADQSRGAAEDGAKGQWA